MILANHMEEYGKIQKEEALGNYILSKNDFKTCSTVNFPKIHPDFGGLKTNQKHKIQT